MENRAGPGPEEQDEYVAVDDYNRFAYYYDLYYRQVETDLDFWRRIGRRAGLEARVLELACGSGRITLPLLQLGLAVTGLDISANMLEIARQRLTEESYDLQKRARLLQGDVRDLDATLGKEQFDLIIYGFNSFPHLLDAPERRACLSGIYRHLAPGGRFVLTVDNPEPERDEPFSGQMEYYGSFPNPARHSKVKLLVSMRDDAARHLRLRYYHFHEKLSDGSQERLFAPVAFALLYREELQTLLEESGLEIENLYGSYSLEPYNSDSPNIILVARKPQAG